jgi:hypothetical protein
MIDLWGHLGKMVHTPAIRQAVETTVNNRINPTRLHVIRDVVNDVRDMLEIRAETPYVTAYTAGELARWSIHSVFQTQLDTVKTIQTGLASWGGWTPATLPLEFFQVLGLMIIDPNSAGSVAAGQFPRFSTALPAAMKTNLTDLGNNVAFQGIGDAFVSNNWSEVVCYARSEFYPGYSHPDA